MDPELCGFDTLFRTCRELIAKFETVSLKCVVYFLCNLVFEIQVRG